MLDVSKALKYPGQVYPLEMSFTFDPCEIMGDEVSFSNVVFRGEYFGADETVNVSGAIEAVVHAHCANCLKPVQKPLKAELKGEFVRGGDDGDKYPLEGHEIDLAAAVEEALLLDLPMRFLCREDCKGLCPVCGKDLNTELCTCPKGGKAGNPFLALSRLLTDQNNEEV